jgi:spermidine synthase
MTLNQMIPIEKPKDGIYENVQGTKFKVENFRLDEEFVKWQKVKASISGDFFEVIGLRAGNYVRLVELAKDECVMSNTWMEMQTNKPFTDVAQGDILIGGLGLGLIVMDIQARREVKSITVVELEKEIIDLVVPQLPLNSKVKVVNASIFDYVPERKFDMIYFDIWNRTCSENWEQMKTLHRKFRKYLKEGGKMSSWREDDCRMMVKEDRRMDKLWEELNRRFPEPKGAEGRK